MSLSRLLGGTVSPILFGWIIDMCWVRWLFAGILLATLGTFLPRTKIT